MESRHPLPLSQTTAGIPQQLALRSDVRLVEREGHLYICSSTGTLRVPTGKTPAVAEGLRKRGLAGDGFTGTEHPLYSREARAGTGAGASGEPRAESRTVAVHGVGPLAERTAEILGRAGVRTATGEGPGEGPGGGPVPDAVLIPLHLPAEDLAAATAEVLRRDRGTPVIVHLSTPTRLLLATLRPPRTACPVCVVTRVRANHTWQPVADLPLDVLLGAAESDAWPTTATAAGMLAHAALAALAPSASRDAERLAVLSEFDHATFTRTPHTLFHTPHCPACGDRARPAVPGREDAGSGSCDPGTSWELMRGAVDPLTGIVPELRVGPGRDGGTTYARTAGMTTTTWFSPGEAEARGGAVKSDPVTARVCAVGETLERYAAGVYDPGTFVRATFAALGGATNAVDPRALPLGSASEYERLPRYGDFDPDTEIDWVRGHSLTTGRDRWVPACAVHIPYVFPRGHKAWYDPISTGLAAGGSYEHAVHGGLMELVERDATVVFWHNRLALPTLDLCALPADSEARRIVDRVTATGARVTCKDLTTDLGVPAVAVRFAEIPEAGENGGRPVVVHAARADLDPHAALLGALEEACLCRTGAGIWLEDEEIPPLDAHLSSLSEFALYYCAADRLRHLSVWDEGPVRAMPAPVPSRGLERDVEEAVRRLDACGYETVTVDLTPVDVAECGVSVVRTLVPGLCPITLRSDFHRRGGPRVFQAPVAMGLRDRALTEDELNPWPLPFL